MNRLSFILNLFLVLTVCSVTLHAQQAEISAIYLKNGQTLHGEIISVTSERILYRVPGTAVGNTSVDLPEVEWVDLPDSSAWLAAMADFRARNYEQAVEKFSAIARNRSGNFYPVPGNFATLAERRLLDCFRRTVQPAKAVEVANAIEWERLPPGERDAADVAQLWVLIGQEQWDVAIAKANELENERLAGDPEQAEVSFLKGLACEGKQEPEQAVLHYGTAYGAYSGANRELAEEALRRSIEILAQTENRRTELKALVQLYAKVYGTGTLWENAPENLAALLQEELRLLGSESGEEK